VARLSTDFQPPSGFGHFLHDLNDLAEVFAARCIHDDVLADAHVRDGG
jgi:hypothetical protein